MTMPANPKQLYPLYITGDLKRTKAFYLKAGFTTTFDMPEYLQVAYAGDSNLELAFMAPHAGSNGVRYETFTGQGALVSIPTPNADAKYAELAKAGLETLSAPEDKPWGWRSFHIKDPNGLVLDFFHAYEAPPKPDEPS